MPVRIGEHIHIEMSMRKPDWSEGIPTLPMNPTPTQIREWNARAALAVKAATGSDFLVKMKNGLTKSTNKETNMTQVVCHAQNDPGKEGYDLLFDLVSMVLILCLSLSISFSIFLDRDEHCNILLCQEKFRRNRIVNNLLIVQDLSTKINCCLQ